MADPPRPSPRQPPPLPPLPLRSVTAPITEPFRDLTIPAPMTPEDRAADTQRTGYNSPPPSRARQAGSAVLTFGKYTAVAAGLLGFAVQLATIWRPDLVGPLQMLQRLVGGP